jgi:meiotic recombination protein SPO11
MSDLRRPIESDARYIVVVEKKCVFDELSAERFFNHLNCILVTASGTPDLATRAFVSRLSREVRVHSENNAHTV